MTAITSRNTTGATGATTWGRFALVGLATTITATVLNSLVYFAGSAVVSYDPDFIIFQNVSPTIIFTMFPAIIATVLYGLLLRFTARPERIFTAIAVVVLLVSFIPDLTYIPTVEGASAGQTTILLLMHVVAAVVIVGMLSSLAPGTDRRKARSVHPSS